MYQGKGFSIISQLFPSLWDERGYCQPCPYLRNQVMVGPQSSIKALFQKVCPLSPLNLHLLQVMAGGGILRDTPSASPTRDPSFVRVIDTATLHHEEVNDDVFREMDEYPANPIAPELAGAGQVQPAGSST
ncbi:hypothetical protein LIER_19558 [Lithospermum erythrorhizon]|uniref:Uncharacterized protein n=1 Tax=Lithospermum erythrorhizon TaxID=34254 RepID=A0AAV3QJR2_LITER